MYKKQKQVVIKLDKFTSKAIWLGTPFDEIVLESYGMGLKAGIKQEKRRQTIAYNKACDKFGI